MLPKSFWGRWLLLHLLAGFVDIVVVGIIYLAIHPFVCLPPTSWLLLGVLLGSLGYALAYSALSLALTDWIIDGL